MWKIPLFDLNYDHREHEAVMEVLRSKWLSSGSRTSELEKKFSEYLGGNVHCCAVSSCTAALHMALLAADIGPGDEVIVSAVTFIAAVNAVSLTGAKPVLADAASLGDWNVSPADIKKKINPATRAVIIVHYAGYPCAMEEILRVTRDAGALLIEDVAHAVGAEYDGKKCGVFGDMACFSFFSNKNLATGEGGMFVCRSEEFYDKAKLLRSHGMTSMTVERHEGKIISYDVLRPGLNYRMDEMRSAIGLVQLSKLDDANDKRRQRVERYRAGLRDIHDLIIPFSGETGVKPSYHIFPVLLPPHTDRNKVIHALKDKGIQTSIHYPAIGHFSWYSTTGLETPPVALEISARALTLPLFPDMTEEMVDRVCHALKTALE